MYVLLALLESLLECLFRQMRISSIAFPVACTLVMTEIEYDPIVLSRLGLTFFDEVLNRWPTSWT
jgi:hypothetical protein